MWILAINLPLIVGDKVPATDEKWECFLLLLDLLQFCTAKVASTAHAGIIEALVYEHHELFASCYPNASFIPKMHYLVHLAQQLLRYNFDL